jgi:putative transposase
LLERHSGTRIEPRHDGRVAVDQSDTRWCSDGFEIGCDNGERVRIAFALDCCGREAISWVATTGGLDGGDIRDLMVQSIERRFGTVDRLPSPIECLSDNGSPYVAKDMRALARVIGFLPRTTPIESPQSNGMAEAFVKTFKRDYAQVRPRPDAAAVMPQLDAWFDHYNSVHPHRALGYRSPREFRSSLYRSTGVGDAAGSRTSTADPLCCGNRQPSNIAQIAAMTIRGAKCAGHRPPQDPSELGIPAADRRGMRRRALRASHTLPSGPRPWHAALPNARWRCA